MTSCHSVIHPYLLDLLSECFVFFTLRKLLPHMLVSGPHVNTQLLPSPTITPPTTNGVLTLVALITVCLKWVIPPSWKLQPPLRLLMSSSHKLRQEFKCLYKMNQKPAGLYQKKNTTLVLWHQQSWWKKMDNSSSTFFTFDTGLKYSKKLSDRYFFFFKFLVQTYD